MTNKITGKQITEAVKELAHADHLKWHSLRRYLSKEKLAGRRAFRLVVGDDSKCYIHPIDKDGATLDFDLLDTSIVEKEQVNQDSVKLPLSGESKLSAEEKPILSKVELKRIINDQARIHEKIKLDSDFHSFIEGAIWMHDFANNSEQIKSKESVFIEIELESSKKAKLQNYPNPDTESFYEVVFEQGARWAYLNYANNSEAMKDWRNGSEIAGWDYEEAMKENAIGFVDYTRNDAYYIGGNRYRTYKNQADIVTLEELYNIYLTNKEK